MKSQDMLTPEELIERYPDAKHKLGWCASKIGMFFNSGLLVGHRSGRECKAIILESSFVELLKYVNNITNQKNINF